MTSYTDKHLERARDLARWSIAGLTFSNEEALELHVAFVAPKIAEALANAERDAFKRAAEIARDVANKCMSRPLKRDPQTGRLENRMQRRYQECFSAGATSVYRAITSEMEGR